MTKQALCCRKSSTIVKQTRRQLLSRVLRTMLCMHALLSCETLTNPYAGYGSSTVVCQRGSCQRAPCQNKGSKQAKPGITRHAHKTRSDCSPRFTPRTRPCPPIVSPIAP